MARLNFWKKSSRGKNNLQDAIDDLDRSLTFPTIAKIDVSEENDFSNIIDYVVLTHKKIFAIIDLSKKKEVEELMIKQKISLLSDLVGKSYKIEPLLFVKKSVSTRFFNYFSEASSKNIINLIYQLNQSHNDKVPARQVKELVRILVRRVVLEPNKAGKGK